MTTEKAIEILSGFGIINRYCAEDAEVLDMAIKALEQQSCEDCISREAVKETIFVQGSAEILEIDFAKLLLLQRAIKALPSVTPKAEQKAVLGKIRAEIEQITDTMGVSYNQYVSKIDVLQIIDKYKAESEVEE